MARAPYQVLILPYRIRDQKAEFCVFRRRDMGIWQFLAGGGEEEDASVTESEKREAFEEAGIPKTSSCVKLDTCCSIPASCFKNAVGSGALCRSGIRICGKDRSLFPATVR